MQNTILVTGATGRVGFEIARRLPLTDNIRIAVRNIESARSKFDEALNFVQFDFENPETYAPALQDVSHLFLMLPPVGIEPVFAVIDEALRLGVQHIVLLSILRADRLRVVPHRRIEKYLEAAPITYTFLRAGYFMQNLSSVHRADIQKYSEIFIPAGNGEFLFVDVRDVAEVGVKALSEVGHENQAYELTGRGSHNFREVAAIFTDVLQRDIRYRSPNPIAFVQRMRREHGYDLSFCLFMLVEYTVTRLGLLGEEALPQLEELLGRPPTTLTQFVGDYRDVWD